MERYEAKHSKRSGLYSGLHKIGNANGADRYSASDFSVSKKTTKDTIKYVPLKDLADSDLAAAFGYEKPGTRYEAPRPAPPRPQAAPAAPSRKAATAARPAGTNAAPSRKVAQPSQAASAAPSRKVATATRPAGTNAAPSRKVATAARPAGTNAARPAGTNAALKKAPAPELTGGQKFLRALRNTCICLLAVMVLGAGTFYLLIGVGLSPKLQTLWVTTAMTTNSHKWLATAIVPADRIAEIMERERIDDSAFNTDLGEGDGDDEDSYFGAATGNYEAEGYLPLAENLYKKEVSGSNWYGYILLVSDPKDLILTDTPMQGEKGTTVKRMVQQEGGIAGINGGGFDDGPNYDSNGGRVAGLLIINGRLISPAHDDGGYLYNMIGFNSQGRLILRHCTTRWAQDNDIKYAVSFSPFLIVNGEGTIPEGSTGGWGIAPRTAVGQRETGEVLLLCIDGRQPGYSIGCDLAVLQDVLLEEGCVNAAMMDGGSSTVMVYRDEFVNKPSLGHERFINNAWVVMPHGGVKLGTEE